MVHSDIISTNHLIATLHLLLGSFPTPEIVFEVLEHNLPTLLPCPTPAVHHRDDPTTPLFDKLLSRYDDFTRTFAVIDEGHLVLFLISNDEYWGMLVYPPREEEPYSSLDTYVLTSIGQRCSDALRAHHLTLTQQRIIKQLVTLETRLRREVAANIHAGVIHSAIARLARHINTLDDHTERDTLLLLLNEVIDTLRKVVDSRLDPIGNADLVTSLRRYVVDTLSPSNRQRVQIINNGGTFWREKTRDIQEGYLFAAQGAIMNALNASPNSAVVVTIEPHHITIQDDGPGFDVDTDFRHSNRGLGHIYTHIFRWGSVDITSTPGNTQVTLTLNESEATTHPPSN